MKTLEQLKKELLADGIIDAEEVKELKSILFADGVIDAKEADLLFELNNAVSGNQNDATWSDFFVEAVSSYLLADPSSPGEIDENEADWLYAKIKGDGKIDENERALLLFLKQKVSVFPQKLESLL
jgi:hypothetical protein